MAVVKTNAAKLAAEFVAECGKNGWRIQSCSDSVITIVKTFAKGDSVAYAFCDSEAYSLLDLVPFRGGSVWGTDGGSLGGAVGLAGGFYKLNKSGSGGKAFAKTVVKLAGIA